MKAYSTRIFKVLAWLYLLFPLTYLALVTLIFGIPSSRLIPMVSSSGYVLISVLGAICGLGLREMKRWSWYVTGIFTLLVLIETAILAERFGTSEQRPLAIATSWLIFLIFFQRISNEIRVPYYFPKIRWWESNPRYKLNVPIRFWKGGSPEVLWEGSILAISGEGCFIKCRETLKEGEDLFLRFRIFSIDVETQGKILWVTESGVTHPKGVGVRFYPTQSRQRRSLRMVASRMRKISAIFRKYRYILSQDDFVSKLNDLENQWVMGSKRAHLRK